MDWLAKPVQQQRVQEMGSQERQPLELESRPQLELALEQLVLEQREMGQRQEQPAQQVAPPTVQMQPELQVPQLVALVVRLQEAWEREVAQMLAELAESVGAWAQAAGR